MQAEEFFSVVTNQEPARNLLKDVAVAIYVPLLRASQFTVMRRVVRSASGVVHKKGNQRLREVNPVQARLARNALPTKSQIVLLHEVSKRPVGNFQQIRGARLHAVRLRQSVLQ